MTTQGNEHGRWQVGTRPHHGRRDLRGIFRRGSKTYFNSARFFPKAVRDDVLALYGFVRKADDYIDAIPQEVDRYFAFKAGYSRARQGEETGDPVVDAFVRLARRLEFDPAWVEAFFASMEMDLDGRRYYSEEELARYIYGSAEVVGLMMARILALPPESYPYARLLGGGMQFINFIRDIAEDAELGRVYFPKRELEAAGLAGLSEVEARANPDAFRRFVAAHVDRYIGWTEAGEAGLRYIPLKYRIPIRTASRMYKWTARRIKRNPFLVFRRKLKPSVPRIVSVGAYYWLSVKAIVLARMLRIARAEDHGTGS